jgi:hypothetical protein
MRFFQPHDYVVVDYSTRYASISSLIPSAGEGSRPGVNTRRLDVQDVEPLRSEIESLLSAARDRSLPSPVSGEDGRRAISLAIRVLERIHEHAAHPGLGIFDGAMPR